MFKIATNPSFTHKVEVLVPVDGGHKKESFKATFRVMPTDQAGQFDLESADGTASFLKEAVQSIDDVVGDDGQPLPYSDDVRDQLLAIPFVRAALFRTYISAVSKAKVGN